MIASDSTEGSGYSPESSRVHLNAGEMRIGLEGFGLRLTLAQIRDCWKRGAPTDTAVSFFTWFQSNTSDPIGIVDDDALAAERLKLIREQRKKLERENRLGDSAVIDRESVRSALNGCLASHFAAIDRVFLSELPASLAGLSPSQIKSALHNAIEQFKTELKSAITTISEQRSRPRRKAGRPPNGSV